METDNFLGARISITTSSALRFIGTIHQLDAKEKSMTLTQEGRSATKAIPPSDQEYSFMKFSGEHIVVCNILVNHHRQDLVVLDEHNANLAQPAASTFEDPAIVAMGPVTSAPSAAVRNPRPDVSAHQAPSKPVDYNEVVQKSQVLEKEFEQMNVKDGSAEGADDQSKAPRAYDKKASFFDNLHTDTRERLADQRKKDYETFGEAGSSNRGRGGWRGGHRGGHEGYSGGSYVHHEGGGYAGYGGDGGYVRGRGTYRGRGRGNYQQRRGAPQGQFHQRGFQNYNAGGSNDS